MRPGLLEGRAAKLGCLMDRYRARVGGPERLDDEVDGDPDHDQENGHSDEAERRIGSARHRSGGIAIVTLRRGVPN